MADDPGSGRFASRSSDAILAEARRLAADIRRRAERDASDIRRDAAEWAATTRREAEEYRDRLLASVERQGDPTGVAEAGDTDAETAGPADDDRGDRGPAADDRDADTDGEIGPEPAPESAAAERADFVAEYLAEHRRRRRWRIAGVALLGVLVLAAGAAFVALNLPDDAPSGEEGDGSIGAGAATDLVELPDDVVGRPLAAVIADLRASGLDFTFSRVHDEEIPAGGVVSIAGSSSVSVPRGTVVALLVSKGPAPRTLPAFERGADADTVEAALEELGLRPERLERFHDEIPAGGVVNMEPAPGTSVPHGATVTITVSRGPDVVEVPDVLGLSLDAARARLEAAALTVGVVHGRGDGPIVDQAPDAGTTARRGSPVNVRRGP